jgi:hypothetical protein
MSTNYSQLICKYILIFMLFKTDLPISYILIIINKELLIINNSLLSLLLELTSIIDNVFRETFYYNYLPYYKYY